MLSTRSGTRPVVVVSGYMPWKRGTSTSYYIASLLARIATVVYVEPRVPWRHTVLHRTASRLTLAITRPMRRLNDRLWLYTPLALPLGRLNCVESLNQRLLATAFQHALKRAGLVPSLMWFTETRNAIFLRDAFPALPAIFHATDYFTSPVDVAAAHRLVKEVDLVLASSPLILKSLPDGNPNRAVLRNGWEPAFLENCGDPPAALADVPSPRLLVVGFLGWHYDFALLATLSSRMPVSLIIAGPVAKALPKSDRKHLTALRNDRKVYFLGEQPAAQIPSIINSCDVCLIPWKHSLRNYAADPLKVYQYLAIGKPVVSSPVNVLEELVPLVKICADESSFMLAIKEALTETANPALTERRKSYASRCTWEARWEEFRQRAATIPRFSEGLLEPANMT